MKVVIYTETFPSFGPGQHRQTGIGRYCYDLACGLVKHGVDTTVLTNMRQGEGPFPAGARFRLVRFGRPPGSPVSLLIRSAQIVRQLRRLKPDITIIGDPVGHQVYGFARSVVRRPYCPILYGTELKLVEEVLATRRFGMLSLLLAPAIRGYLASALERIVISRYTCDLLYRVICRSYSHVIVYPAVSEVFLSRQPHGQSAASTDEARGEFRGPGRLRIVTVGRISERKNQLAVLNALTVLTQEGFELEYRILGNVDDPTHNDYLQKIQRSIREYGLDGKVAIVENTSDEEKVDEIDGSDLFIMVSKSAGRSVEGFGISVIEASCRGKPVIVSDEGGMPETIVEGETGLSVPPEDVTAIAAAIRELARAPSLRTAMGRAGAGFVRDNFTPERMGAQTAKHLHCLTRSDA